MKKSAIDIANHLLFLAEPEVGELISNLKLQKLLYYVQGFHLAINNKPLFKESIIKWQYGPVVIEVYHEFKECGSSAIPKPSKEALVKLNSSETELIEEVYNIYGQFSATKLMDMTHREKPWRETKMNGTIKHDTMKNYFKNFVK